MSNKLLIDAAFPEETRVVLLNEKNILENIDEETFSIKQLKGNIYLAKIIRVEPSLQSAFINYGGDRHGFLPMSDIHPDYYNIPEERKTDLSAVKFLNIEDKQYIKEGTNYTIRLVEDNGYTLKGYLKKVNETEDGIELFFLITNGVEELADLRDVEIEIVWWSRTGLTVSTDILKKYDNKEVYYINAIKYSEIVEIPVKIVKKTDKFAVITNYSNEELEELGIDTDYKIKLYDRIIIK
jgi:Ribonuclease G/E